VQLAWIVALALAAITCAGVAGHSWRLRSAAPAARAMAVTLAGCSLWSTSHLVAAASTSAGIQLLAIRLSFGCAFVSVLGTYFVLRSITDLGYQLQGRVVAAYSLVPGLVFVGILASPVPGPFLRSVSFEPSHAVPHFRTGWVLLVATGYCYVLLGDGLRRVLRGRRSAAGVFRTQFNSMVLAAVIPVVGNAVTIGFPDLVGHQDLTPLLLTCSALIDSWALLRQGLLRVVPVAREHVVNSISDGVIVIDARGRIVDMNPAAKALMQLLRPGSAGDIIGADAADLGALSVAADLAAQGVAPTMTYDRRSVALTPDLHADLRITVVSDARGRYLGRVLVCRDITDLVDARAQMESQLDLVNALQQELVELSLRDPLTGLHNRRHLDEALNVALANADRTGRPVSMLIIDADHFKAVNDRHGHQVGDATLVALAALLRAGVRTGDTIARFGGEEFVVLMPGADRREARRRAEQLCAACQEEMGNIEGAESTGVESHRLDVVTSSAPQPAPVTVSIGLGVYPEDASTADALLAAADRALYLAKKNGRNQVVDSHLRTTFPFDSAYPAHAAAGERR